jgi:hypothetical protein
MTDTSSLKAGESGDSKGAGLALGLFGAKTQLLLCAAR